MLLQAVHPRRVAHLELPLVRGLHGAGQHAVVRLPAAVLDDVAAVVALGLHELLHALALGEEGSHAPLDAPGQAHADLAVALELLQGGDDHGRRGLALAGRAAWVEVDVHGEDGAIAQRRVQVLNVLHLGRVPDAGGQRRRAAGLVRYGDGRAEPVPRRVGPRVYQERRDGLEGRLDDGGADHGDGAVVMGVGRCLERRRGQARALLGSYRLTN